MTIMRIMSRTMPRFHIQAGAMRNFGSLNFTSLVPGKEQLAAADVYPDNIADEHGEIRGVAGKDRRRHDSTLAGAVARSKRRRVPRAPTARARPESAHARTRSPRR